jgi:hypothetical protein
MEALSLVLRVKNVRKLYGALEAIRNVSLDVAANEFVSILGPSGCGKEHALDDGCGGGRQVRRRNFDQRHARLRSEAGLGDTHLGPMDQGGSTGQQGAATDGAIIRVPSCPQGPAEDAGGRGLRTEKLRAEGIGRAARCDVAGRQGPRCYGRRSRRLVPALHHRALQSRRALAQSARMAATQPLAEMGVGVSPGRIVGRRTNPTRTFRKEKRSGNHYFDSKVFTGLRRSLSGFSDAVFKTPATFIWSIRPRAVSRLT